MEKAEQPVNSKEKRKESMKKAKKYSGVVVPMVSPLLENKTIDREAVTRIVRSFAKHHLSPLVLGTTGESSSIGPEDSRELVKAAVQAKGSKQHIYAGLVGNNEQQQIDSARQYFELGADVVVATLPSYYILTPDQMVRFYETLADNIPGPLMLYNIKATTQMSIPLPVIERLSRHENIRGLKDSERDIERLKSCINTYKEREDFSFFCGWGAQCASSLQWGADGIVPSTGNLVPDMYRYLYEAAREQDIQRAETLQAKTDEVGKIYQENRTLGQSLAALKVLMGELDLCKPYMMPPLTELEQEEVIKLKSRIADYFRQTLLDGK